MSHLIYPNQISAFDLVKELKRLGQEIMVLMFVGLVVFCWSLYLKAYLDCRKDRKMPAKFIDETRNRRR